jgi:hypothetical protein
MSKSITVIFLLASLFVSGCTLLDQLQKPIGASIQKTPTLGQVIQASATMDVSTPTITSEPTPNLLDTQLASERDNNAQELVIVDKRLTAVNLELTVEADKKTIVSRQETNDAQALISTGTLLAVSGTNDQAARDFQREIPTIIVAGTQATYTGTKLQSEIAFNWLSGLSAFAIALAILIAITTSRKVAPSAPATQGSQPPATQKQAPTPSTGQRFAPVHKNGMGLHVEPPGNHAHFMIFALAVCSGQKGFSKTEWEGSDSPYNRKTYRVVYDWLWEMDFIELPPGEAIRWTAEGQGWVDNWIDRNLTASPIADDLSAFTEFPAENSQPPEIQGAESGGGGVESEEDEMEPA